MSKVIVFDPTASDELSKVRGVGRYMQILRENFPNWQFTNNLAIQPSDHSTIFINPFINFLQKPATIKRLSRHQIGVIHDLIPLKYSEHFPTGLKGKLNIFLNKLSLMSYDVIVTDSEASKKDIIQILRIKPEKIKVIYPTLPKIFNSESKIQNSKLNSAFLNLNSKFIIYVGDVTWNKNIVNIAKAVKMVDIKCVFVGRAFERLDKIDPYDPWQKEFFEFSKIVKGDDHFIFPGFVNDRELIKLYRQAVVNILISRDEGFGFSYFEAAASGCPSVLSETEILVETAQDAAIFANPQSPREIAAQLEKICSDEKLRALIAQKAKARLQLVSQQVFIKNFESIL